MGKQSIDVAENRTHLSVRNLWYSYPERPIFAGLNLELGGRTAVLGPSGCGKTTLLRLLAGRLVPDSGVIDPPGLRAAVVFQEPRLLAWRTVEQNIDLVLSGSTPDRHRKEYWLAQLGLESEGKTLPARLSGGMRQRVALARALATDPGVLLVDEPLTGLDAVQSREVAQVLGAALVKASATVVVVTHDIDLALELGERIVVLGNAPDGPVLLRETAGRPREALREEILSALVAIRSR